jgi:branched-chain amino acid transport system ATP-binding protein
VGFTLSISFAYALTKDSGMTLLKIKGLVKSFGALQVLDRVCLELEKGELHSVIGPNGAGKTTLFNVICGQLLPDHGAVEFEGKNIVGLKPYDIAHLGIGRSFQIKNIFPALTVLENIRIAVQLCQKGNFNIFKRVYGRRDLIENSLEILGRVGLSNRADWEAKKLAYGEQRTLDVAIALATDPVLLLLDEPTSGLAPQETNRMIELIKEINRDITILLIEHKMKMVMSISDKITVLHQGKVISEGMPSVVQSDALVRSAYLGDVESA